jgi:hypothetical protein
MRAIRIVARMGLGKMSARNVGSLPDLATAIHVNQWKLQRCVYLG